LKVEGKGIKINNSIEYCGKKMSNGRTTVEIDYEVKERLKKYCEQYGRIQYHVANKAIKEWLDEHEEENSET
jgi:predicted transcriptional regulator